MRTSWDEHFLQIADLVSEMATCNRLSVGCVLVKDKRVVSTGFNGSIRNQPHCVDVGCLIRDNRCIRTLHAEENALLQADPDKCVGATAYVTHYPCENCMKRLNHAGVNRVVYRHHYNNEWTEHFTQGMEIVHIEGDCNDNESLRR